MFRDAIWELKSPAQNHIDEYVEELNISELLARLLLQRGMASPAQARKFLHGSLADLSSPWRMSGMEAAVLRINKARDSGERIVVYGDYDVDGVCSVVIMLECLQAMGCAAAYYIPDRFQEGYGLNLEAVQKLARQGCRLLITVDCGINSWAEIDLAGKLGMDVIITDHHTPGARLPAAAAVINPSLDGCPENKDLAGAGVAYQLARALGDRLPPAQFDKWLLLAALATIADVVPLRGDNRILVKEGLKIIRTKCPPGMEALLQASGLEKNELDAWHLAFILAPRLNAAGRLENARLSVELLMNRDPEANRDIAKYLCCLNDERKKMEEIILNEAAAVIDMEGGQNAPAIILAAENWHHGVLGITASRLCDHYRKPVLMIGWEGEAGRGSARSLPGYNIFEALVASRESLIRFGGHSMAAGFNLARQQYASLRESILRWAEAIKLENPDLVKKRIAIDAELDPEDINERLMAELEMLKPFGEGNPEPVFVIRSTELLSPSLMGKEKEHFKARLPGQDLECIAFKRSDYMKFSLREWLVDLAGSVKENKFRGRRTLQFRLLDARASLCPDGYGSDAKHQRELLLVDIARHLERRQGVIITFPTLRVLKRGRIWLEGFFNSSILEELHGMVHPDERSGLIEIIKKNGSSGIYLSTNAFISHHAELQNAIDVLNWPEITVPDLTWRAGQMQFESFRPCMIYVNRPSTVKSWQALYPGCILEAGLSDNRLRRKAHREFFKQPEAIMLTDGGCIKGVRNRRGVQKVFFCDAPFSCYEASLVAEHLMNDGQEPVGVGFSSRDLEANHQYLEKSFPDPPIVEAVWQGLQNEPPAIAEEAGKIASSLAEPLGRPLTVLELEACLRLFQDLDLCRVQKKGSIMAIKVKKRQIIPGNLSNSAFFLEGQAEKAALTSFEKEIRKALDW